MKHGIQTIALLAIAAFTQGAATFGQATVAVPPLGPPRPLSLPSATQSTLPNGLRILVVEDHRQPAIYLRLVVPAGIAQEPAGKAGLASLTAGMLTQSTTTQTHAQIAEKVDTAGASLHARAESDYLSISIAGIANHATDFCDLIADLAEHPTFPEGSMSGFKEEAPSEIAGELSDPATLASTALNRVIYGDSPYGNPSTGTLETINALTRSDAQVFYDKHFSPSNSVLFFVGDITDTAARAFALKSFGSWSAKAPASPTGIITTPVAPSVARAAVQPAGAQPDSKPTIIIIDRPGAQQTEIRIGTKVGGYGDSQRIAGEVATAVLGAGQFESRLMQEIRVTRGLTYSINAEFERNRDAGEFAIKTYTKNASTGEVLHLVLSAVRKLAETPPGAAELTDHKTYLAGSFAVSVASTEGFLGNLLEAVLYGDGPSALTQYTARVDAITAEDVSKVIASLHIESAHIVLVGDAKAIEPQVRDIGAVSVIKPAEIDLMSPTLRRAGSTQ